MDNLQTVLVVDDDHLEREYLVELLIRSGFVVRDAATVPNALAVARSMRFDMVFIDDTMSGTDGAKALRELKKALTMWDDLPKLYLLGDSHDEGAIRYRENGFTGFLDKPVELDSLLRMLDTGISPVIPSPSAAPAVPSVDRNPVDAAITAAGLDVKTGIDNCGSRENYLSAIGIFYTTAENKAAEIEQLFADKDWENYTIKVHALKSSARIIGASDLSVRAAAMEDAGNRRDEDAIAEETPKLIRDYRIMGEKLKDAVDTQSGKDERPQAPENVVRDAWHSIGEFAEQMDYDLVEMVIKSLEAYRLAPPDASRLERIRTSLLALDWDTILQEVK